MQFLKKLEAKSIARAAENAQLSAKSKVLFGLSELFEKNSLRNLTFNQLMLPYLYMKCNVTQRGKFDPGRKGV